MDNIFVTAGRPLVKVPVLSKIIVFTLCAFSRISPPLIKIPNSAPFPVPTMMAVGVASPKAQGQAITNTATIFKRACVKAFSPVAKKFQPANVRSAITITIGTKIPETVSASL